MHPQTAIVIFFVAVVSNLSGRIFLMRTIAMAFRKWHNTIKRLVKLGFYPPWLYSVTVQVEKRFGMLTQWMFWLCNLGSTTDSGLVYECPAVYML